MADPRRKGCSACEHANPGTPRGYFPSTDHPRPCTHSGPCPYGLDALLSLPDEKESWRPYDEVPLRQTFADSLEAKEGQDDLPETRAQVALDQGEMFEQEVYADLFPLLLPFVSFGKADARQREVIEAILRDRSQADLSREWSVARATVGIYLRRAEESLRRLFHRVTLAASQIVARSSASKRPLERLCLRASFTLSLEQSSILVRTLGARVLPEGARNLTLLLSASGILRAQASSSEEVAAAITLRLQPESLHPKDAEASAIALLGGRLLHLRGREAHPSIREGGLLWGGAKMPTPILNWSKPALISASEEILFDLAERPE